MDTHRPLATVGLALSCLAACDADTGPTAPWELDLAPVAEGCDVDREIPVVAIARPSGLEGECAAPRTDAAESDPARPVGPLPSPSAGPE